MQVRHKGRGAVSNPEGRFETQTSEPWDDGWNITEEVVKPKTTVSDDVARSIITKNQSPDIPFEQSINPYRGCEHGCIYCYARQSHAFLGLSAGLDFETKLFRKPMAAKLLEDTFRKPNYQVKPITLGSNTDPYQPIERTHLITRQVLQVMTDYRHPLTIITKGAAIVRDLDLLTDLAKDDLVHVLISLTTLDPHLARTMEPRAASPQRRLSVIRELTDAGIPVSVNVAPIIPGLNDHEIETILSNIAKAGALAAGYTLLRLPYEVRDLFVEWLETHFPLKAGKVMSQLRQMRDGKDYRAEFGLRFRGTGHFATLLRKRFRLAVTRDGLARRLPELNCDVFRKPLRPGDQIPLFEV